MADNSRIEWTDATWNPITGCSVVSPGCTNCYAMRLAGTRLEKHWSRAGLTKDSKAGPVWTGEVRLNDAWLEQPLRWRRPRRIFVCAHGDLFHENVPDDWIDKVFAVMALAPRHTFQVLTKRADRMRAYIAQDRRDRINAEAGVLMEWENMPTVDWPTPNVWLGVSVEDQARADARIPDLLATPAAVRFVSAEPLLGPVDLEPFMGETPCPARADGSHCVHWWDGPVNEPEYQHDGTCCACGQGGGLDWVIAGGESGPGARPVHPDWMRSLRDQCADAGVPLFFKQWGEWAPPAEVVDEVRRNGELITVLPDGQVREWADDFPNSRLIQDGMKTMTRVGKKRAGARLDGVEHRAFPAQGEGAP